MLVTLSPAKRLDWDETPNLSTTSPKFQTDAVSLCKTAGRLSRANLQQLMGISPALAELNQARFRSFEESPGADAIRPAIRAFAGDTYIGLDAASLDDEDLGYSQDHLRILSGLYGVLQPLDGIQPYRLEMGSRLATRRGKSLYAYWGKRIAKTLNADASAVNAKFLVNCASQEYFKAVDLKALTVPVITPVFLEERDGATKIISFFAKKARGAMARFIITNRVTDSDGLKDFDLGGYRFAEAQSDETKLVFVRPEAQTLAAE